MNDGRKNSQILIRHGFLEEDMLEFQQHHLSRSPAFKRQQRSVMLVMTILITGACLLIADPEGGGPGPSAMVVAGGLVSVLFCVIFKLLTNRNVRNMTQKMLSEGANDGMFGEHLIEVDDEGIRKRSRFRESYAAWPVVRRMEETDGYLLIYVSSIEAHVIPKKRVMEGDLAVLTGIVEERIADNNRLW